MKPSSKQLAFFKKLQHHADLVGKLAYQIAQNTSYVDDAFIAGMLHDVGKLLLASRAPAILSKIIKHAKSNGLDFSLAEEEINRATHAQIGGMLLGQWNIPHYVVEAIVHHHDELDTFDTFDLAAIILLANLIALEVAGSPDECPQDLIYIDRRALKRLGVDDQLDEWYQIAEKIHQEQSKK